MRIAVIADTHNRYPPGLPERLRDADEIWHLGDVCDPDILVEFEQLGPPLQVVLGNNDSHSSWPVDLHLERAGLRFYLTHIPPAQAPKGVAAVLHGHTHLPRDETQGRVRWLNPGCISFASRGAGPSFAWLTLEQGQPLMWKIMPL